MSNSLDPDQARRFVGPDLGPNCLPRLSADDTDRQRFKAAKTSCAIAQLICVSVFAYAKSRFTHMTQLISCNVAT